MPRPLDHLAILILLGTTASASYAAVNDALDTLYTSGQSLKSLAADLSLENSSDLGDKTTKTGSFVLQRVGDGDSRARVNFTQSKSGKRIFAERREYVLAGTDLIDRDYTAKKQVTRQIRKPGEKVDFFKLGEGPFPLPIGQSRADVLAQFDAAEEKNDDPTALAVIKLTPKPKTAMADDFKWIRVTIDRQTKLPRVITTLSASAPERNTATLTNVRVNDAVKDEDFKLEPINPKGWDLVGSK